MNELGHNTFLCERRYTMLDALANFWPKNCSWTQPLGGLFLWATLPNGFDTTRFLSEAIEHKVAFAPGIHFYPNRNGGANTMRLNFSYSLPQTIIEGVDRLGKTLAIALENIQ